MLKFVKAVSVSAVLLAAVTVATVGYFMVFGTGAVRQREEALQEKGALEAFRKLLDAMPESDAQISPLVEQARKLALRINPPKPPEEKIPEVVSKMLNKTPVKEKIKPKIVVNVRSDLLATCKVEAYPEKSLALIDLSAKGHQWVREGDEVGHLTVHRINDGSIVLYQGNTEHSVLNVPERKASSLLKTSSANVSNNIDLERNSTKRRSPNTEPLPLEPRTTSRKEPRKLPERPSAEQQKAIQENHISKIENIINETKAGPANKKQEESLMIFNKALEFLRKAEESQRKADEMLREKKK